MNIKYLQLAALFCIELILFMPMSFISALQIVHQPNPATVLNETSAVIRWQTDENATAVVDYGTTQQLGLKQMRIEYDKLHEVTLYNLTPNARYYFQLMSITSEGEYELDNNNGQFYSFLTQPAGDTIPPGISNVALISITATTATIRWQTDEPATSIIYLGEEGTPLNLTNSYPELVSDHIITAPAVEGKRYNYVVASCDRHNNCRNSTQYFFVGGADITPPEINVELPEWHLSNRIDITGMTEAYATVNLYVNGQNVRRLQPQQTGAKGEINLQNVALPSGENNITITAEDQVGNNASRDYVIKIDPTPPVLVVAGVPAITNDASATLTVNISEPCTVIFEVKTSDETAPAKVSGLKEKSKASTMVELEWNDNKETDFEEYAVYRLADEEDAEWIRIGTSRSKDFRDTKVAPGKEYSYRISAVDKNCNEGALSDTLKIQVPEGGGVASQSLQVTPAELTCEKEIDQVTHDGGTFQHLIEFEDGLNRITITAKDRAGHTVVYRNQTVYDMNPPEFLTTNLDDINPTYVQTVTVSGNVSEKATVQIYVNDEKADEVETDANGYFAVPVELSKGTPVSASQRQEISVHLPMLSALFGDKFDIGSAGPMWLNTVKLVAVDLSGSKSQPMEQTIVYTICGLGSWYKVDIGGESGSVFGTSGLTPEILNPRLMIEGNEIISFPINLTYIGGYNATLMGKPSIRVASLSKESEEDYDIDWVTISEPVCDQRTQQTCLIQLQVRVPPNFFDDLGKNATMYEKEEKLSNHRKDDCIVSATGCIKVPMMLEIDFKEIRPRTGSAQEESYPGQPNVVPQVQKKCWELEVGIDQRVPPSVIPVQLLEFGIGLINATLEGIEAILEPISTIKEYVFYACTGMWVVQFIYSVYANFQCRKIEGPVGAVVQVVTGAYEVKIAEMGVCDLEYTDKNDKSYQNCKNCQDSVATRASLDWTMRQFCDRIFCPSAPTFQKYIKDQASKKKPVLVTGPKTKNEYYYGSSCGFKFTGNEESKTPVENKNQVTTGFEAIKAYYEWYNQDKSKSYPDSATGKDLCTGPHTAKPRCCGVEYMYQWGSACGLPFADDTLFSEIGESLCLAGEAANQNATISGLSLSPDSSGQDSLTCHRTFNSVVGFCDPQGKEELDMVATHRKLSESVKKTYAYDKENDELFVCLKPNFKESSDENIYNYEIKFCFPTSDISIRQNQTNANDENTFSIQKDTVMYTPPEWTDLSNYFGETSKETEFCNEMNKLIASVQSSQTAGTTACKNVYEEVKNKIGSSDKQYIVDPTGGFIRAFQCICLSAMTAYLKLWQRALTAINNCFQTILITGDGSAGMCEAVLSTYICDLLFELIQCFTSKYSSGPSRSGFDLGLGDFAGALTKAGSDVSDSVAGRYGESAMWKSMFVEQKLVHAICLWIFTGTWDIDISELLDAGDSGIVTDTIGMLYPAERRFRSYNPVTTPEGLTTWIYHFGIGIIPGADLTYTLKLICSDDYSCSAADGFESGRCDCRSGKQELSVMDPKLTGTLSSTGTLDEEVFFTVENKGVRYDKAVLEWEWTDNSGNLQKKSVKRDINQLGGNPPAFCSFDIAHGVFRCSLGFEAEYWARFNSVSPSYPFGQPAFKLGEPFQFVIDIQQAVPVNPECTTENCDYTKYLTGTIYTPNGAVFWNSTEAKRLNTRGQSIITDFVPASQLINSPQQFNTEMQKTPATTFTVPCMGGYHPTVTTDTSKCQGSVTVCSTLCQGGLGIIFSGANIRNENYVLVVDKKNKAYKVFKPASITSTTGVTAATADINHNFYKIDTAFNGGKPLKEGTIGVQGETRETIDFQNGQLSGVLLGMPVADYAEIVYTAGTPQQSTAGVDMCSQNDNYAEASARKWRTEFTIYPARQFGNRYEPDFENPEPYAGYKNPYTTEFVVVCNQKLETVSGQILSGECSARSAAAEPRDCWCSNESRTLAKTEEGSQTTDFDCKKGQFCVDYKCGNLPACDITDVSKAAATDCICGYRQGTAEVKCSATEACYYKSINDMYCALPTCKVGASEIATNNCNCSGNICQTGQACYPNGQCGTPSLNKCDYANTNQPEGAACVCVEQAHPDDSSKWNNCAATQTCYSNGTCGLQNCTGASPNSAIPADCYCGGQTCLKSEGQVCGLNAQAQKLYANNYFYSPITARNNCLNKPVCTEGKLLTTADVGESEVCYCLKPDLTSSLPADQCKEGQYCCASNGNCVQNPSQCPQQFLTIGFQSASGGGQTKTSQTDALALGSTPLTVTVTLNIDNQGNPYKFSVTGDKPTILFRTQQPYPGSLINPQFNFTIQPTEQNKEFRFTVTAEDAATGNRRSETITIMTSGITGGQVLDVNNVLFIDEFNGEYPVPMQDGAYLLRVGGEYRINLTASNQGRPAKLLMTRAGYDGTGWIDIDSELGNTENYAYLRVEQTLQRGDSDGRYSLEFTLADTGPPNLRKTTSIQIREFNPAAEAVFTINGAESNAVVVKPGDLVTAEITYANEAKKVELGEGINPDSLAYSEVSLNSKVSNDPNKISYYNVSSISTVGWKFGESRSYRFRITQKDSIYPILTPPRTITTSSIYLTAETYGHYPAFTDPYQRTTHKGGDWVLVGIGCRSGTGVSELIGAYRELVISDRGTCSLSDIVQEGDPPTSHIFVDSRPSGYGPESSYMFNKTGEERYVITGLGFGEDGGDCGPVSIYYRVLNPDCTLGNQQIKTINSDWNGGQIEKVINFAGMPAFGDDRRNYIATGVSISATGGDVTGLKVYGRKLIK